MATNFPVKRQAGGEIQAVGEPQFGLGLEKAELTTHRPKVPPVPLAVLISCE